MQLLDLPNELLLKIFEYGETDALIGGASQACHRLREISDEPELWHTCLYPQLRSQYLTPQQIEQIPALRLWCLQQHSATRRTLEGLDMLVSEMHEASPEDVEAYVWQILKLRLRATEGLNLAKKSPKSIAHYHWAHWLTEIMYRLEGVHMLLAQSTTDNWGNGCVERPIEQIIALFALRNGEFPAELFDAVYFTKWQPKALEVKDEDDDENTMHDDPPEKLSMELASELVHHVRKIFATVSTRNDFLSVLGRGALFLELALQVSDKVGWYPRLLTLPLGSYVCIEPPNSEAFFIDFQREGKLRSLEELRDRFHQIGATGSVRNGVSLYDTLATSYVWHTAPTPSRHCVLDLIEHAANDVQVTHLAQAPRLYTNLVHRIIKRNVSEVENAPLSRAVSSASLASMFGANPGGWLRRGKIVRILAGENNSVAGRANGGQHQGAGTENETETRPEPETETGDEDNNSPPQDHIGVVLEVTEGSALVLNGSEPKRVIKQMLQPVSHVPLTSVAGLRVPDIGADLCFLGQYFMNYNTRTERFE